MVCYGSQRVINRYGLVWAVLPRLYGAFSCYEWLLSVPRETQKLCDVSQEFSLYLDIWLVMLYLSS